MPVNAKGRLKYPDFLSRFSVEKATTPPAPGNSAAAQGGSGAPQTPGEGGSAVPPRTHSPGAGPAPRRQRCVSAPSRGVAQSAHRPGPGQARPGVPAGSERSRRGLSLRCPGKGGVEGRRRRAHGEERGRWVGAETIHVSRAAVLAAGKRAPRGRATLRGALLHTGRREAEVGTPTSPYRSSKRCPHVLSIPQT